MRLCFRWLIVLAALASSRSHGAHDGSWVWVEGETPTLSQMNRHPWWYDQVKKAHFSGGDFISNFSKDKAGEATYRFDSSAGGTHDFWIRANPLMTRLSYSLNGGGEAEIWMGNEKREEINVAADNKPDIRFLAWIKVGKVVVNRGTNTIRFRMHSENSNHGYLDCFVLSHNPFRPRGLSKPDELAQEVERAAAGAQAWVAFDPPADTFGSTAALDLRYLNEREAGENGWIGVRDGKFVHSVTGKPVRFWAVNGPPHNLAGDALKQCARMLAKRGVNLVRIHGGVFERDGEVDPAKVQHTLEVVEAMKAEGIYCHLSIYFPLWLRPAADTAWLKGYDGKRHPFAALFFNRDFQAQYRKWWTALLGARNATTGLTLADDPALAGVEIQNEDSFFFWTFSEQNLPEPQLTMLEGMFGDWLKQRYGSLDQAFATWKTARLKRDNLEQGRVAFRPLWTIAAEKSLRDQDTVKFLFELQSNFYDETYAFLRKLGFKGVISASNWTTANPEVFGPLEKWSYATCDFIDRHGYFGCNHKGDAAEWSIRNGHTYSDRSAYRFDAEMPGKPRLFVHPGMDVHYAGKPTMISETTWNRPNRYRSEAPVYLAVFGALQHTDSIVHFALDGAGWAVKPNYFMQPWTLMSPAMMGQFPASALIYRNALISPGEVVVKVNLNTNDLLSLKGTPLAQEAALDELRLRDIPKGNDYRPGSRIDLLVHFVGRTDVQFTGNRTSVDMPDLSALIDHSGQKVVSGTGELKLDYGKGVLLIDADRAQGVSGAIGLARQARTKAMEISSDMELGHIVAVSLDNAPISRSKRILLQVMSEEQTSGYSTEPTEGGEKRIVDIGTDPWLIKRIAGTVRFKRPDASKLEVTALDHNGYLLQTCGTADEIKLMPAVLYYLITAAN